MPPLLVQVQELPLQVLQLVQVQVQPRGQELLLVQQTLLPLLQPRSTS